MTDPLQRVFELVHGSRWHDARTLAEQLILREPRNAQAWFVLGAIHGRLGTFEDAESCCRRVIELEPGMPAAYYNLGVALLRQGKSQEAASQFSRAVELNPTFAEAFHDLGNAQQVQGLLDAAVESYRKAIMLDPSLTEAHHNLGRVLQQRHELDAAIESYRAAVRAQPTNAMMHFSLGEALWERGSIEAAVQSYREAIRNKPDFVEAHQNLAAALQLLCRFEESIVSYRRVLGLKPDYVEAHVNLGLTLWQAGRPEEAAESCVKAIALRPGLAPAHNVMALVLWETGRLEEAAEHCRAAIAGDPSFAEAHNTLATVLKDQGRLDEAVAHCLEALALEPSFARAHSNLLFTLNYLDRLDGPALLAEHLNWAERHVAGVAGPLRAHRNEPDPGRRLRVGYLSPDFYQHSVAFFIEPILAAHDRRQVEVYGYASVMRRDALTARLRGMVDHWRDITPFTDTQIAKLIEEDGIDILVDLAGHTAGNRLPVFARRPAPVQVTYLGYLNTTGMAAMDYRLTDEWSDPAGESDDLHTETLVRLPGGLLCFSTPPDSPAVEEPPALSAGCVTFGCFNNSTKITPEVIALWSEILKSVPGSRLLLKSKQFADIGTQRYYRDGFQRNGIEPARVDMAGNSKWRDYLESYQRIDIALDPFPYAGGTVTCHALWMGVPVITLAGRMGFARTGVSILSAIGLPELVADSREAYRTKAVELAGDRDRLRQLRAGLRPRMQKSTLMDHERCVASLEERYRWMWRRWCEGRDGKPGSDTAIEPGGPV
ncbi:MAG: tetratricopeptide repeat protein [Gammaproteobacteria bacterium]|nr:tetratricopeptide repeat protein [Gammaproteobacteria bacterium]